MRSLALLLILAPLSCPDFDMQIQLAGWRYGTQLLNKDPVRTRSLPIAHFEAKLDEINREINAIPYINDDSEYGERSTWLTPVQLVQTGGQCRDYAVAKYSALYALGVADADMQFVAVRIRDGGKYNGRFHAILLVTHAGRTYILDNLHAGVRPASAMADYQPVYFINRLGWRVAK